MLCEDYLKVEEQYSQYISEEDAMELGVDIDIRQSQNTVNAFLMNPEEEINPSDRPLQVLVSRQEGSRVSSNSSGLTKASYINKQ